MDIKNFIRAVPDFPKEGVLFRDITPLLSNPEAYEHALDLMCEMVKESKAEVIAAIESRGFIFACPIASKLKLPFVPIRKPGKLPSITRSVDYELEYGKGRLEIHEDSISKGAKVAIVDDLLATGGTAKGAASLIHMVGGEVCLFAFLIELSFLHGKKRLQESHVKAVLTY